jgi:hypothetical protein
MDRAVWVGGALGALVGLAAGLWQAWDMRHGPEAALGGRKMASAALRLMLVMLALLAAYRFAGADKVGLACGVVATYTAVFVWRMKRSLAKKK